MGSQDSAKYAIEIREYLLGRVGRDRTSGDSRLTPAILECSRLSGWWIFEGRRYRGIERPLAFEWARIARLARQLAATQNPRWRTTANPEGEVNWLATAHSQATTVIPEYLCRTSQLHLGDDEAEALAGWQRWIWSRWREHIAVLGRPEGASGDPASCSSLEEPIELRKLKRWAQIARRSRWPLLRSIVAESLRADFEAQFVDQLPLPSDPSQLFELICLVRILRALDPMPVSIRWLDLQVEQNCIRVPGVTCHFQKHVPREEMLMTDEFAGGLRDAVIRHAVSLPGRIDGLFIFDQPRAGFVGLLIEAKSGGQDPRAAIFQLKSYRAALRNELPGPLIVWGIVEEELEGYRRFADNWIRQGEDDLWVFSSAGEIQEIMRRVL